MSTTVLYLAIVAIWAGFLVPAWIRRPHGAEVPADDVGADEGLTNQADQADRDDQADQADQHEDQYPRAGYAVSAADEPALAESDVEAGNAGLPAWDDGRAAPPPQSRAQMLRARRRVFAVLVALTVGAAACVWRGLLPWWAVVPPAAMLTLYALLLREIVKAEVTEAARWRAAQAAEAATPAWHGGEALLGESVREPVAEVIDISSRIGDQLYDQYADAAVRAVGD